MPYYNGGQAVATDDILAIEAEARAAPVGESGPEGVTPTHARIALAAALSNAKIDCDYGEDVDRLVAALEARGYTVATRWYPTDCADHYIAGYKAGARAPLDVERLARALHRSYDRDPAVRRIEWSDLNEADRGMWRRHAAAAIREYAKDPQS